MKKLLFLLANLICQLKILTYHSIMLTQIINAKILTPQGWLKDGSVLMRDNKILEVTNCDLAVIGAELIDAKGMYVVPGGVESIVMVVVAVILWKVRKRLSVQPLMLT